jgi:hypothetical protein
LFNPNWFLGVGRWMDEWMGAKTATMDYLAQCKNDK